jgi:hypothetical protein
MIRTPVWEFESQASGQTQCSWLPRRRRFWGEADINQQTTPAESVQNDPQPPMTQRFRMANRHPCLSRPSSIGGTSAERIRGLQLITN